MGPPERAHREHPAGRRPHRRVRRGRCRPDQHRDAARALGHGRSRATRAGDRHTTGVIEPGLRFAPAAPRRPTSTASCASVTSRCTPRRTPLGSGTAPADLTVRNPGRDTIAAPDITVALRGAPASVLEHGWQSWSVVRRCAPDDVRPERSDSSELARAMHCAVPDLAGNAVVGDQMLVSDLGVVGRRSRAAPTSPRHRRRHQRAGRRRGPRQRAARAGCGKAPSTRCWYAAAIRARPTPSTSRTGVRRRPPGSAPRPRSGGAAGTSTSTTSRRRRCWPTPTSCAARGVEVVQVDDGYQRAIGEWLDVSDRWAMPMREMANAITATGAAPGIWTAPFLAAEAGAVVRDHPDWIPVHRSGRPLRGAHNENWGGWTLALDTTNPAVLDHLRATYRTLARAGLRLPQDRLLLRRGHPRGPPPQPGDDRARSPTPAGLDAVREGIGDDAFLLGCGCPFGPAVGVVDAMRVSADVGPRWDPPAHWPGFRESSPAAVNAVQASVLRAPMHRRLWINDPDCLLVRPTALDAPRPSGAGRRHRRYRRLHAALRRRGDLRRRRLGGARARAWPAATLDVPVSIDDPFASPLVVRGPAHELTVDWDTPTSQLTVP